MIQTWNPGAKVVKAFSDTVDQMVDVDLHEKQAKTAIGMLLLGMINWTHMWYKPDGILNSAAIAHLTSRIFTAGITSLNEDDFKSCPAEITSGGPQSSLLSINPSRCPVGHSGSAAHMLRRPHHPDW